MRFTTTMTVVAYPSERGLPVHQVAPNLTAYDDNGQVIAEVDLNFLGMENRKERGHPC
ncbi:hypothetical protein [Allochromatium palmeri]|uniref:hypothetical protein n=1 Tax=Allochromatium palmeri TaxID=231048 RepID=UPI00164250B4|nr:hypothetical protein [Allochromatium palmeri]